MGMLLVRDTTLYFQEVGKGDALLFIHGMCGDANTWDRQVNMLAGGFRCSPMIGEVIREAPGEGSLTLRSRSTRTMRPNS